jgi:hypothetical protein
MPKPNYKYEKRQKEIAKQKKKAEKLKRKQDKKPEEEQGVVTVEGMEEKNEQADPVAKEETSQK